MPRNSPSSSGGGGDGGSSSASGPTSSHSRKKQQSLVHTDHGSNSAVTGRVIPRHLSSSPQPMNDTELQTSPSLKPGKFASVPNTAAHSGMESLAKVTSSDKENLKTKSDADHRGSSSRGSEAKATPRPRKQAVRFTDMEEDAGPLLFNARDSMYMRAELQRELDFGVPAQEEAHRYAKWCEEEAKAERENEDKGAANDYTKADKVVHPKRLGDEINAAAAGDGVDLFSRVEQTLAKETPRKKEKEKKKKKEESQEKEKEKEAEKEKKTRRFLKNIIAERVMPRNKTATKEEQENVVKRSVIEDFFGKPIPATPPKSPPKATPPASSQVGKKSQAPSQPTVPPTTTKASAPPPQQPPPPPPPPQQGSAQTSSAKLVAPPPPLPGLPTSLQVAKPNPPARSPSYDQPPMASDGLQRSPPRTSTAVQRKRQSSSSSLAPSQAEIMSQGDNPSPSPNPRVSPHPDSLAVRPSPQPPSFVGSTQRPGNSRNPSVSDITAQFSGQDRIKVWQQQLQLRDGEQRRPSTSSAASGSSHRLQSDVVSSELGLPVTERRPSTASMGSWDDGLRTGSSASNTIRFPHGPPPVSRKNTGESTVEIISPKPRLPPIKPSDLLNNKDPEVLAAIVPQTQPAPSPASSLPSTNGAPPQSSSSRGHFQNPMIRPLASRVGSFEPQNSRTPPQQVRNRGHTLPLPNSPSPHSSRQPSPSGQSADDMSPSPLPIHVNPSASPSPLVTPRHSPLPPPLPKQTSRSRGTPDVTEQDTTSRRRHREEQGPPQQQQRQPAPPKSALKQSTNAPIPPYQLHDPSKNKIPKEPPPPYDPQNSKKPPAAPSTVPTTTSAAASSPPPAAEATLDVFSRVEQSIARDKALSHGEKSRAHSLGHSLGSIGHGQHREGLKEGGKKLFGRVLKRGKEKE